MTDKIILGVYGLLLLLGGYFGFKAGSKVSLIMGGITGILVLLGVFMLGPSSQCGYWLIAGISGLLTVVFSIRFLKTFKVMPAGMLLLLSVAALIFCLIRMFKK